MKKLNRNRNKIKVTDDKSQDITQSTKENKKTKKSNSSSSKSKPSISKSKPRSNKLKVIVYGVFVVIWMVVIFLYSAQNAVKSGASSSGLTHFLLNALTQLGIISACNITPTEFVRTEGLIRTLAHFSEYFIFGIITFKFASYTFAKKMFEKFIYPFTFCVLYAITDEIHQFYVPGRAMQLEDWLVDSAGVLVGVLIVLLITKKRKIKTEINIVR